MYAISCQFKLQIENLLSLKIKTFRSNGGGECMTSCFQTLLTEDGIVHQVSCPCTLKQNGCAGNKHYHVVETRLALF